MHSLTLDLGSTFFKACIFDNYRLVGMAAARCPITHPKPNRSEINPQVFQRTIASVLTELKQNWPQEFSSCLRFSFASQANSFVLLDEFDNPLTPIVAWTDTRAAEVRDNIADMYGAGGTYTVTGMPQIGRQMMPAKLGWIAENQPQIFRQARRLCSISDYLTYLLTGEHLSEAGAACLSGMVDIHKLKWTDQSIAALNLEHIKLPRIVRAGEMVGKLKPKVASELEINQDCQFVMGCLDQYAGAIGAGNTKTGAISETTGTVMATVSLADHFDQSLLGKAVIQGPAFERGKFYRMVAGDVSANLIEKYRKEHAPDLSYEQLDQQAAAVFKSTNENYPHGQALLGIYQRIAEALSGQVNKVAPDSCAKQILCVGGAAASDCLLQLKADALGIATVALTCAQPTSLGAAILAQSDITPVAQAPKPAIRARFEPELKPLKGLKPFRG